MGKNAKGKGKGKAAPADFAKVRNKVGKRKLAPMNATDTSFKAKVVHMPTQSVGHERSAETTDRGLSMKDLLGQARHYSPNVRRDALQGMKEIFSRNALSIPLHLAAVVERTVELTCDPEPPVRRALLSLLRTAASTLDERRLRPFFPLLVAHTASAMTHIRDDVRLDSLDFVDLWLERVPGLVASRCGQLLPNFIDLIAGPSSGSASRSLHTSVRGKLSGAAARESILRRLLVFFEAVFAHAGPAVETEGRSVSSAVEVRWGDARSSAWLLRGGLPLGDPSFGEVGAMECAAPDTTSSSLSRPDGGAFSLESLGRPAQLAALVRLLTPVLLECWVEAGPAEVSGGGGNVACMELVAAILGLLWGRLDDALSAEAADKGVGSGASLASAFPDLAKDLQRHFMATFPLAVPGGAGQSERARVAASTNAHVCCLLTRFADGAASGAPWSARVREHVHTLLQGAVEGRSGATLVSADTFAALLESVDRILAATDDAASKASLLSTLVAVCDRASPTSAARMALADSLARHLLPTAIPSPYGGEVPAVDPSSPRAAFASLLPKAVWQLGASDPAASAKFLAYISRGFRAAGGAGPAAPAWAHLADAIVPSIAPFFAVVVAGRKGAPSQVHFGPFVSLPPAVQAGAADVLFYANRLPEAVAKGLVRCLAASSVTPDTVGHVLGTLEARLRRLLAEGLVALPDISMHLSILLSVAVGYSPDELSDAAAAGHAASVSGIVLVDPPTSHADVWRRRMTVVGRAAAALTSFLRQFADVVPELRPAVESMADRGRGVLPADAAVGLVALLGAAPTAQTDDRAEYEADMALRARLCVALLGYVVGLRHRVASSGFAAASESETLVVAAGACVDAVAALLERDADGLGAVLSLLTSHGRDTQSVAAVAAARSLWELVGYKGPRRVHDALAAAGPRLAECVRAVACVDGARDVVGRLRAEAGLLLGNLEL